MSDRFEQIRLLEAILFAAAEPLGAGQLTRHLPEDANLDSLLEELKSLYANRGVNLVQLDNRWAFRTASDLAPLMQVENTSKRKLSRVALETLAIIAYHQPVTRGEIEEIRGVALSKGTLDALLEIGWIKPRGRRRTPGRPVTWGTSPAFLDQFGLPSIDALPGVEELKAAGLIDARPAITALGDRVSLPDADQVSAEGSPEEEALDGEVAAEDALEETFAEVEEPLEGGDEAGAEMADGQETADPVAEEGEPEPEVAQPRTGGLPQALADIEEKLEKAAGLT